MVDLDGGVGRCWEQGVWCNWMVKYGDDVGRVRSCFWTVWMVKLVGGMC